MKTNFFCLAIILVFSWLLPVPLAAQLSDNEREDLNAYINNNSAMMEYALNLRTKLLNDVELSKSLKQCSQNISIINFVKNNNTFFTDAIYQYLIPLKETTDKIMNKMTYNFLIELFPEYKTFKDDINWLANLSPVYINATSVIFIAVADNSEKLKSEYLNYRNLFNARLTIENIQVTYAKEYESMKGSIEKSIKNEKLSVTDYDLYIQANFENEFQTSLFKKLLSRLEGKKSSAENDMVFCDRMILAKLEEYRNKEKEENLTTKIVSNSGITGTWMWFTGEELVFSQNGQVFKSGIQVAKWRVLNDAGKKYEVSWPDLQYKPIDELILSNNDSHLEGKNQYGNTVTANKIK